MPLDDDDPEKWHMREHTAVKHRILRKYLFSWTRILSSGNPKVHYFDGFAGRGRYEEGDPGSPLLALDVADSLSDHFERFYCTFNELNGNNFNDLKEEVERKKENVTSKIEVDFFNEPFEDIAVDLLSGERYGDLPSLVFIDPFGYQGTPFSVVAEIMNLRRSGNEVFFTFMVDKIRRFLDDPEKEETITRTLGTEDWEYIKEYNDRETKENELLKLYENQLYEVASVNYVFPFQMKHPERDVTVYYLLHATNHFKGLKIMKDVMFREGAEEHFSFLGPEHYGFEEGQTTLFESTSAEDQRIPDLADYLYEVFNGRRLRYWEVMKETYLDTDLIQPHYRQAIELLVEQRRAIVYNFPERRDGTSYGIGEDDEIEFGKTDYAISDFDG